MTSLSSKDPQSSRAKTAVLRGGTVSFTLFLITYAIGLTVYGHVAVLDLLLK